MLIKSKIKEQAITLFNSDGVSSVTMRQIAIALGISPGNLTYHFKTKADLIAVIYQEIHSVSNEYIVTEGYITLHDFEMIMRRFDDLIRKYRFFFDDVVYITRQFPEVAKMYESSNLLRFKQARRLIDYYVVSGRMKPENDLINYDQLIYNIWIMTTFWSSQDRVISLQEVNLKDITPVEMAWQIIFPHLTEMGLQEYHQIREFVKTY